MDCALLNRKGQVAIEFILLLVIMVSFIHAIILPTVYTSIGYVEDVARLSEIKLATENLMSAIDYVALSPGDAKRTVNIFVPEDGAIFLSPPGPQRTVFGEIVFEITLSAYAEACGGEICKKTFSTTKFAITGEDTIHGPEYYTIVVTKIDGDVSVEVQ